ncbi:uncharacterized protein A1O5_08849 [Cladophialophora psammophila CBS 110553]|uniref:GST N-terminal domain-containing protein n=1 Tax=Cladophialophora psammophila CBS 110553 TaxID=1182543 RepID=W9XCS1_9EURO|nr:uncharacterized protein A1O5_08849 [Cladophialophora psammophila CBS 110553]EXJ68234.1 hypothetical protein A1O5_08849 [Cladophialophora psammophila CBS 110553]
MEADTLQTFAAAVQQQYPAFSNENDSASQDAAAAAGYAPAESLNASPHNQSYPIILPPLLLPQQTNSPPAPQTQTRRQSNNSRNTSSSSANVAMRSPQQARPATSAQTRAFQNAGSTTPSRTGGIVSNTTPQTQATQMSQQPDNLQVQPDPAQSQKQNGFVFRNSSSAYPNGTPTPARSSSKQSQVYTTPHGVVQTDPWMSHYQPTPSTTEGNASSNANDNNDNGETEPVIAANPFSDTFPLVLHPPNLEEWRNRLFNIVQPLVLSEEEFLTYFPHVDNIYSHRSTQKYKRKAFVSHYWDCRLKGRPSGTPKSDDPNKQKRKRQARERDLCDVKIKITEYFSAEDARKMGLGAGNDTNGVDNSANANGTMANDMGTYGGVDNGELTIVMEDGSHGLGGVGSGGGALHNSTNPMDPNFGLLELPRPLPRGHPGADGKRWFTIQRVRGNPGGGAIKDSKRDSNATGDAEDEIHHSLLDPNLNSDLDHKHTLEESDRIKKNSVQRWLLKEEKEKKRLSKIPTLASLDQFSSNNESTSPSFKASGMAFFTARSHAAPAPTKMTFFANSFCPFAQRIWIALEIKGIPYQMVEIMPTTLDSYRPPEMLEVNPEGNIPCIRHGNWGVWESGVVLEYLEDLSMGHSLLPLGNPQLRAHCRLWTDHINRKILPSFYSLLLTPPPSPNVEQPLGLDGMQVDGDAHAQVTNAASAAQHSMLVATLQKNITALVNASHATGPFFLGNEIGFVDVVFAPWIIRLSRVLSYYRNFPKPEVGTRWRQWVDAIEGDDRVRRTVSDENSYHGVYRGVGEDGWCAKDVHKPIVEIQYARKVVAQEGFGLGGDVWGRLPEEEAAHNADGIGQTVS